MMTIKKTLAVAAAAVLMASCVTQAKYNEAKEGEAQYYAEARKCAQTVSELETRNDELSKEVQKLKRQRDAATADTARLARELQRMRGECDAMQKQAWDLIEKMQICKTEEEVQALLAEIQGLQTELMQREDALFAAERALDAKRKEIEQQSAELQEKSARIEELTALLEAQSKKLQEMRDKIRNALTGYEGDGLQVTVKNGRIYVSLDEKLLFESGRWEVAARGADAIGKLSGVLADNKDMDILVEGHTDNIPFGGNGNIADNWDLSVKRATAIVRILLQSGAIEPARVIASGRAEHCPVDTADSPEARQKNRRCEIILSPKLDELMKLFD
ncbi:MAG: OmpA family protein [Paludibacteraceae bacterium]|nr:OmpA family protein [Paludibacteraceae bacterium]